MITLADEGFTDFEVASLRRTTTRTSRHDNLLLGLSSVREKEELVYALLKSLPRSSLATIQRNIVPLLQLDVVGLLPDEVALLVYSFLPWQSLLTCSLVSKRWNILANDQGLWRSLCAERKWVWRNPPRTNVPAPPSSDPVPDSDDEGMGDDEESDVVEHMLAEDSSFSSMLVEYTTRSSPNATPTVYPRSSRTRARHSAISTLSLSGSSSVSLHKADHKLLFQTHIRLDSRFRSASYNLSCLQTRGAVNGHANAIYCLQLYTYPDTGKQVLFTGSKDHTVREWDLTTSAVIRVIEGVHVGSVLTICVFNGIMVTGGSDRRVAVWDLNENYLVKLIQDHEDSVLCVRFDEKRLVSCSKDRTIRTYLLPDFRPSYILDDHRAAVNAVSISPDYIVSASGDRSIRVWDANTGAVLRSFEEHHGRGIASVAFKPPYVVSGSSDNHLRLINISTSEGWSTSPDFDTQPSSSSTLSGLHCATCGNPTVRNSAAANASQARRLRAHEDLVRTVALNSDFVITGSYDHTIKVWDRKTGAFVADLSGGHSGRIFCVGFDCSKIVSCGEDQRICIWDFSHGIDTSFIKL